MTSKKHVTALGKALDMHALRAKHEKMRAVGNMNVNARGDIIDSSNNIINDNNQRVNAMYNKTMQATNRIAQQQKLQEIQQLAEKSIPTSVVQNTNSETQETTQKSTSKQTKNNLKTNKTINVTELTEIELAEFNDDLPNPNK